jgi:hypothetical protein
VLRLVQEILQTIRISIRSAVCLEDHLLVGFGY